MSTCANWVAEDWQTVSINISLSIVSIHICIDTHHVCKFTSTLLIPRSQFAHLLSTRTLICGLQMWQVASPDWPVEFFETEPQVTLAREPVLQRPNGQLCSIAVVLVREQVTLCPVFGNVQRAAALGTIVVGR